MADTQTETIANLIAGQFGLTLDELRAKNNNSRLTTARNFSYIILHKYFGVSLNGLADLFGRTNREICYRTAKMREQLDKKPAIKKRCETITNKAKEALK